MREITYAEAINEAMVISMSLNKKVITFGLGVLGKKELLIRPPRKMQ